MNAGGVVPQTCLLCGSRRYEPIKRFAEGVVVGRCADCGLLYTPERLEHPEALFAGASLELLRAYNAPLLNGRFEHYRAPAYRGYLSLIARHCAGRRLLDVGCANGFFLHEARRAGYETMGIEPSGAMAAFAREELGLDVRDGRADQVDLGDAQFDVITMTDAFEYLPEPIRDLRRLSAHLAPGGVLFIKVPNGDYFALRHRLETLAGRAPESGGAFTPPLRVAHYTLSTMRALLSEVELAVLEMTGFAPIDSAGWDRLTGLSLSVRAPWYLGLTDRLTRRVLHAGGMFEQRLTGAGRNHLSQSIVAIAGRTREAGTAPPQEGD
jgi:2-polyprenyl-3-methyl-5-hydroxy-6-metoxy-1,4-benzoquinol methylase